MRLLRTFVLAWPRRLLVLGLVLVAIALGITFYPTSQYIFLPDKAHAVAPLITVQGGHVPATGGVYYVDVVVRKATVLERLFGGLHKGADLYPASQVNPPGVNSSLRAKIDLEDMSLSKQTAAAVALRKLGRKVTFTPIGALVANVIPGEPAVGKLAPDDVITEVGKTRITGPAGVFKAMSTVHPGQVVRFTFKRLGATRVASIRTVPRPGDTKHAVVGIEVDSQPAIDIHLPIPVRIDTGNVGGPSAGLAFALEIMEELGPDILHGNKVAATGQMFADGSVGAIGGIKQKTYGARDAHVNAFLVPVAGDNARDAKRYAGNLKIIPVKSFQQALQALKTLPPVR
ncbi:MAG TPA: S16 family serine protease [Gaiellaceae bacterium]|nr:S16 family serine protease [Gaiellaceae bacterium]